MEIRNKADLEKYGFKLKRRLWFGYEIWEKRMRGGLICQAKLNPNLNLVVELKTFRS